MYYALQVLEIIQTHTSIDLFNPELEKEKQKRTTDPVTTDLLGALLSVSTNIIILESFFEVYTFDFNFFHSSFYNFQPKNPGIFYINCFARPYNFRGKRVVTLTFVNIWT